jgi:hypothetical protein
MKSYLLVFVQEIYRSNGIKELWEISGSHGDEYEDGASGI